MGEMPRQTVKGDRRVRGEEGKHHSRYSPPRVPFKPPPLFVPLSLLPFAFL